MSKNSSEVFVCQRNVSWHCCIRNNGTLLFMAICKLKRYNKCNGIPHLQRSSSLDLQADANCDDLPVLRWNCSKYLVYVRTVRTYVRTYIPRHVRVRMGMRVHVSV